MSFPRTVTFRRAKATIYGRSEAYPCYRVSYYADGKRRMKSFTAYGGEDGAKAWAERKVRELSEGNRAASLQPAQADEAWAAFRKLDGFFRETGKRLTLLDCVTGYCAAVKALGDRPVSEAIAGFLGTVATVQRVKLDKAVEEFIAGRAGRTIAKDGKRPQLSPGYHYNVSMWLREFSKTLPGYDVCDLSKRLLDTYMGRHGEAAPKTRNERRGVVRMFIQWATKRDYLPQGHRLLEAEGLIREQAHPEAIEFYTAGELRQMLTRAGVVPRPAKDGEKPQADYRRLLPVLVITGLAGLRLQEVARLRFEDCFRIPGYIEVSGQIAKTRSRRLVTVGDALAQWLAPYSSAAGPIWAEGLDSFHTKFNAMLAELEIAPRRNGLRHAFVSYHYALYADEGRTAQQAGNSPQMVHQSYKGLATAAQAKAWLDVRPATESNVIPLRKEGA